MWSQKIRRNINISNKSSSAIAQTFLLHRRRVLLSISPSVPHILVPPDWSEISGLFSRTEFYPNPNPNNPNRRQDLSMVIIFAWRPIHEKNVIFWIPGKAVVFFGSLSLFRWCLFVLLVVSCLFILSCLAAQDLSCIGKCQHLS